MKIYKVFAAALFVSTGTLVSCGPGTTQGASNSTDALSTGAAVLGAFLGGGTGTDAATSLLTGVIGSLLNGAQSSSIVGTWTYTEPSVEFTSESLLAQAGGLVAANQIVTKMSPYYQMIGIKPGNLSITFNEDKTCVINVAGTSQTANYVYDAKAHTLQITGQNLGLSFGTVYATVSSNQLSLTLDSSRLLSVTQSIASQSQNATISTLGTLAGSFSGMKTGFKFTRK